MKYLWMVVILAFTACSSIPPENVIQTAIAQTQAAAPTNTKTPIPSPTPTNTPKPTITPKPTSTSTPTPQFDRKMKTIDDTAYNLTTWKFPEVTITKISIRNKVDTYTANDGYTYVIADVKMKNHLSFWEASYGAWAFVATDEKGVIHEVEYLGVSCELSAYVNVMPEGTLEGCIIFEVPDTGRLTIIFAPYESDRFGEGRCLRWAIKY